MAEGTKRLLIKASNDYDQGFKVVSINTKVPTEIESQIGTFSLCVSIKNFDGSEKHRDNSLYNKGDKKFLNGEPFDDNSSVSEKRDGNEVPNLSLKIQFKPKTPIKGSDLIFGNDFLVPIHDYVPTSLLTTGLKFFNWFINSTVKGDVYAEKPYLYGSALSTFSYIGIQTDKTVGDPKKIDEDKDKAAVVDNENFEENLNSNYDNLLDIPKTSIARKRFFSTSQNGESFVFNENTNYVMQFDTNFIKLSDSKYSVSIPTFGNRTFDIDVVRYANSTLNNFNWTIKSGGFDGVGKGTLGLILNFALVEEDGFE